MATANQKLDKSTKKDRQFERQNHGITRIDSVHIIETQCIGREIRLPFSLYFLVKLKMLFAAYWVMNFWIGHTLFGKHTTSFLTIIVTPPPIQFTFLSPSLFTSARSLSLRIVHVAFAFFLLSLFENGFVNNLVVGFDQFHMQRILRR